MLRPLSLLTGIFIFLASCNSDYTPRPKGYFKIEFPQHAYQRFDETGFPYSFEYPVYGSIARDSSLFDEGSNPFWINIDIPRFHARVYLSYKQIGGRSIYKVKTAEGYRDSFAVNQFDHLRDEAYKMTYKHSTKASSIEDSIFKTPSGISGVFFKVGGNAATSRQFYLTDTTRHFLRGALYFDATPNEDSLSIVDRFLMEDMRRLVNSLQWK